GVAPPSAPTCCRARHPLLPLLADRIGHRGFTNPLHMELVRVYPSRPGSILAGYFCFWPMLGAPFFAVRAVAISDTQRVCSLDAVGRKFSWLAIPIPEMSQQKLVGPATMPSPSGCVLLLGRDEAVAFDITLKETKGHDIIGRLFCWPPHSTSPQTVV